MKRIIVPCGYMSSGSSAITDLVSEFKDCQNEFKSFEYVLLHCPNGLFDLEDKLLINNNAIRSDEAIRTFESKIHELYDKKYWWVGHYKDIIGKEFLDISNRFIKDLTHFNYPGFWYEQENVDTKMLCKLVAQKPVKVLTRNKVTLKKVTKYNDGMKISLPTKEEFYSLAHDYIYDIVNVISKGKQNIILDQFLLPFNLHRIDNYFDDRLKVVVVERDPRDVFILNKYISRKRGTEVPFPDDVNIFCEYYIRMRESEIDTKSNKVLRIRFEDLIYKYDEIEKKVADFLGFNLKDHINKFNRFNPQLSIKNTQLFRKKEYIEESKIIERKLKKYLYDFPYELNNDVKETLEFE